MKKIVFTLCFLLLFSLLPGCQATGITPVRCISKATQTYGDGSVVTVTVDCDSSGKAMEYIVKWNEGFRQDSFTYDDHGNVLTKTYSSSNLDQPRVTTYQYDARGNLLRSSDSPNTHYDYTYDENGVLIKKRSFFSGKLSSVWTYDSNRNLIEEYRASGNHYRYTYNDQNLLTAAYRIQNGSEFLCNAYTYREDGKLLQTVNYDILDNGERKLASTETYTYDFQGNLLEMQTDSVTFREKTTWTYDGLGRKLTEDYSSDYYKSHHQEWTYDQNGNLTSFIYDDIQYTWSYDKHGNLVSNTFTRDGSTSSVKITYTTLYLPADAAERVQALQTKILEYFTILDYFRLPELP